MLPALPAASVGFDLSPAFSPDGRTLVFARSDPNSNGLYVLELTKTKRPRVSPNGSIPDLEA
jgi:Tol biopolymer transport system component